jgi:hypothetical protein
MSGVAEKGGGSFHGIKLLRCARWARGPSRRAPASDFAPHDAAAIARRLAERRILVKPLADTSLGPGFMRVTTATPSDNRRFVDVLQEILADAPCRPL